MAHGVPPPPAAEPAQANGQPAPAAPLFLTPNALPRPAPIPPSGPPPTTSNLQFGAYSSLIISQLSNVSCLSGAGDDEEADEVKDEEGKAGERLMKEGSGGSASLVITRQSSSGRATAKMFPKRSLSKRSFSSEIMSSGPSPDGGRRQDGGRECCVS
jgi:hypothetical protein